VLGESSGNLGNLNERTFLIERGTEINGIINGINGIIESDSSFVELDSF